MGFGPEIQVYGDPALTGKVKKVFEFANEEAASLNHNYVGTEHLFLAFFVKPMALQLKYLKTSISI